MAQDSTLKKLKAPFFISGSFLYDFPQSFGTTAGIDFPLKHTTLIKEKNNGYVIEKNWELIFTANAGFYRYEFNHTGLLLSIYLGKRHHYKNASYFETLAGAGLLHTVYDGNVYVVDDNGTVKQKNNYGRTYATINIAPGYGIDLTRIKKPKPFTVSFQPIFWLQFPYNSFVLPHGSLALTIKYHLPNTTVSVKNKIVHKSHHV